MKMKILILAIGCLVIAGAVATGCDSARQKVVDAEERVREANKDLATLRQEQRDEAHRLKMEKEWKQYKEECELAIEANDNQIAELEKAIKTNEKGYNKAYIARVNNLKEENELIRSRIRDYELEEDVNAWEEFKSEVNHDMQNLSDAFKNLSVDNVN